MKRENHLFTRLCVLGFTVFICGVVLLKNGTAIVVDRDSVRSVQPNLRAR